MALLKIINGDSAGAAFAITDGSQRVGRAETNNLRMPDGSVSSQHCEVSLDAAGNLFVRDLGSTNGTFIEGTRVREALVLPGQKLRLGNLELLYENPLARPPASAAPSASQVVAVTAAPAVAVAVAPAMGVRMPPPPVPGAAPAVRVAGHAPATPIEAAPVADGAVEDACINHPSAPAIAVCKKCGTKACNECTKKQKVGRKFMHFCPRCGGSCVDLGEVAQQAAVEAARAKTFGQSIGRAFSYPFKGNGLIILICGTIFFGALDLMKAFSFGIIFWSLRVMMWGYLFAFMQSVVRSSADGEDLPPEFPAVSDYHEDIVVPFRQLFITLGVALLPSILGFIFMGPLAGQFALLLGALYFPMALLGVAMSDSYGALNPVFVLSSVVKCFGQYLLACVMFTGLMIMFYQVQVGSGLDIPVIGYFFFWFIFLVFLIIAMRVLGMLYYFNRRKLGWGL